MKRRNFLETTFGTSIAASFSPSVLALEKRPPRILLRSSWQTVNIGDIAHTPGVLAILEKHFPEAEIRLWPSQIGNGVEEILLARFPKLIVVKHDASLTVAFARLRYTPYWTIPSKKAVLDHQKRARNDAMKEHDCKPLRDAITAVVKNTELKILLCPEVETQMAVNKEMLLDKLPEDIRARCVWREKYWLTAEALSTYRRSAGLFGHEMHSPIVCNGNGIPAIVCCWSEQTSKGIMWRDIGLGDWLFDNDDERKAMPSAVLAMAKDFAAAKAKAAKGREFVEQRQRDMVSVLKMVL